MSIKNQYPLAAFLLLLAGVSYSVTAYAASISGPVTTYNDGDTLEVWHQKIRLIGIDAPEMAQECKNGAGKAYQCGDAAANHLKKLIGEGEIRCEGEELGTYGRLLATCYLGEVNLNQRMVEDGWAVAFVRYDERYLPQERLAREAGRGIWAGEFTRPVDFRARGWEDATDIARAQGGDCKIKGKRPFQAVIFI